MQNRVPRVAAKRANPGLCCATASRLFVTRKNLKLVVNPQRTSRSLISNAPRMRSAVSCAACLNAYSE